MQLQVAVFKEQVELSEKYELPLIIHCVKAMDELLALRKERAPKQRGYGMDSVESLSRQNNCYRKDSIFLSECITPVRR